MNHIGDYACFADPKQIDKQSAITAQSIIIGIELTIHLLTYLWIFVFFLRLYLRWLSFFV